MGKKAARLRAAVIGRALVGPGVSSPEARRAAFDNRGVPDSARVLIEKVARHAWQVTDEDVDGTKAEGMIEDEVFELVVCAALGQAARQLEAALAALDIAARPRADGQPSDDHTPREARDEA